MKKFIVLTLSLLLCACGALQLTPSKPVCESVPADSYSIICQLANQFHTTPENVSTILKVSNAAALAKDVYDSTAALNFINGCQLYLQKAQAAKTLTYPALFAAVQEAKGKLKPEVQALFVALNGYQIDVKAPVAVTPLSDYDYDLLQRHLSAQRAVVAPFLVK